MVEHNVAIVTVAGRGMGAGIAAELHAKGYKLGLMSHPRVLQRNWHCPRMLH